MRQIGYSRQFSLLVQESHLTKNALLSGFDLLIKTRYDEEKDGLFYAAFFHLSIGMERMLKLAVVVDHMLQNQYEAPTKKQLQAYGHDIKSLILKCDDLQQVYRQDRTIKPRLDIDTDLLDFLSRFAKSTRYFNFDELAKQDKDAVALSPLYEWQGICRSLYSEFIPIKRREASARSLMYKMDSQRILNGFTKTLDATGHPMTVFDILYRQECCAIASKLAIWRVIECYRPVYFLLNSLVDKAAEYENSMGMTQPVVPHFEDFFYFLLADRSSVMRRKRWLTIFNA